MFWLSEVIFLKVIVSIISFVLSFWDWDFRFTLPVKTRFPPVNRHWLLSKPTVLIFPRRLGSPTLRPTTIGSPLRVLSGVLVLNRPSFTVILNVKQTKISPKKWRDVTVLWIVVHDKNSRVLMILKKWTS